MTLNLKYSEVLQGLFEPDKLNLMMTFQVNCPGCFLHGFPQMIHLHEKYREQISFFSLSTAFEDFDLNTAANTKSLVREGILIGETAKAFNAANLKWDRHSVKFPILIDELVGHPELVDQGFIDTIINSHPHFLNASKKELTEAGNSLRTYFDHYPKCGYSFAANLCKGTPTYILFSKQMKILLQWFGHAEANEVEKKLNEIIATELLSIL